MARSFRHRFHQCEPVAQRDDVPHRKNHRTIADAEPFSDLRAVGCAEAFQFDADGDVDDVIVVNSEARFDVLANEHVHRDDIGMTKSHEGPDDQLVGDAHGRRVQTERALETGVNREHRRDVPPAGPDRAQPGQVEELTVLVHDVGFEVVEQAKQTPCVLRRGRERDVVVERDLGSDRQARQAHDPQPVAIFLGRSVPIAGGHDEHFVSRRGDVPRQRLAHMSASARARRKEGVDHRRPHGARIPKP